MTRKTLIWVDSSAAAIVAALHSVDPKKNTVWLVADPVPYTLGHVEEAMADAAGITFAPEIRMLGRSVGTIAKSVTKVWPFSEKVAPIDTLERFFEDVALKPRPDGPVTCAAAANLDGTLTSPFARSYGLLSPHFDAPV